MADKSFTRTDLMNMLYERPVEIGHFVGYKDLTDMHNKWLKEFLFGDGDYTLQAHRGSYKTTDLSLFFGLHTVLFPNESIIYMRKTDSNVTDIAKQTQNILMSGAMQEIIYALYGVPLQFRKQSATEIDTNLRTTVGGASQLAGFGCGASITGKHADIIVTDDIINLSDRISRAEREHTKGIYQELQNVRNRGGRIINCGTPWHKEDAFSIMPEADKYDCYTTGLITPNKIKELRKCMAPSLFAANYELRHIASEDTMFSEPHWADDVNKIYGGKSHVDAAYGGEDFTAFTVMNKANDGFIYAYGKLWHKHVDDCKNELELLHDQYYAGSISCETNGDKGYLAKSLREDGMQVNTYSEKQNKYIKIATYLRANWDKILWIPGTDPEYIAQILDYTENAEHDDAPDSAATLIRSLQTSTKANTGKYLAGGI